MGRNKHSSQPPPPIGDRSGVSTAVKHGHTPSRDCWCKPAVKRTPDGCIIIVHRHIVEGDDPPGST